MWSVAATMASILSMATSDIRSDEVVVFFPAYAHFDEAGRNWEFRVHGVIFEPEEGSWKRSLAIGSLRRSLGVEEGSPEARIFDRRARLFMVDHERGKDITIRLGQRIYQAGTSGTNGHFAAKMQIPAVEAQRLLEAQQARAGWISFEAVTREDDRRRFTGRVQLAGREGPSIISDVDDTIKHSKVGDKAAMLANTFLRDFKPVPGMAELYRDCARRGFAFHYVSGSPWQLYRPLAEFCRTEGFPSGSFHLKHFRLSDSSAANLLRAQEDHKLPAIEAILAAFPERRFVLIGDSGEQDPEIYGKIARKHGDRIARVLIRNVTDEPPDAGRFRAAFRGVPSGRWRLFRRPEEIRPLFTELGRSREG